MKDNITMVEAGKYGDLQNSMTEGPDRSSSSLSICISGRDDDYMVDFKYRITTTINHLAHSICSIANPQEVEILVTDWGSRIPMAQTLDLSAEAVQVCRFIYVSPQVIRASQGGKDDFHISRAPNVAIRRARGKYILLYGADTLIQKHSLAQLMRLLNGEIHLPVDIARTFFLVPRIQVPWQFLERRPGLEEWDRYLLFCTRGTTSGAWSEMNQLLLGGAGGLMMHRFLWHQLRGLDEHFIGWGGNDNDLGFRATQNYPFLSLYGIGVTLYHMEHPPSGGRRLFAVSNPNPLYFNTELAVNDENWGLGDIVLKFQAPRKSSAPPQIELTFSSGNGSRPEQVEKILSELTSGIIREKVRSAAKSFLFRNWEIDPAQLNSAFFLAWYSRCRYPRKYLEFAVGRSLGAGAVAMSCPSAEIYKIDRWEGESPPHTPYDLTYICDYSACENLRLVNGDISTAVQRLRHSFVGPFEFDLIQIRGELLGNSARQHVFTLMSHLAKGGALVFGHSTVGEFATIWAELKGFFPRYTFFQCTDRRTGMVLAIEPPDDFDDYASLLGCIPFETEWLTSLKRKRRLLKILRQPYTRLLLSLKSKFTS